MAKSALAIRGFSSNSSGIVQELILKIVICRFVKLWKLSEMIWAMLQGQGDGRYFRPCPLAGQRAAELASGEIWQEIDALNTGYLQDISQGNACTDQAEIDAALKYFSIGKSLYNC